MHNAWTLPPILLCLTACASDPEIITRTEFIEIEVCEGQFREIPPELVDNVPIQAIPETATWRQLVELLIVDRANLEVANGRIDAIRNLDGRND